MVRPVSDFRISYRGELHLKVFYRFMIEQLMEEDWVPKEKENINEVFYYENETPEGKEVIWWWRMTKKPTWRGQYYVYVLDVDVHARTIENIEVVKFGKKLKTNKGEIEIKFNARVVEDPKGLWRTHWFWKHVNEIMWKRLMKTDLVRHKMYLYRLAYKLQSDVKNYFKLMRYQPPELPFRPQLGTGKEF